MHLRWRAFRSSIAFDAGYKWFRLALQQFWKDVSVVVGRATTRPVSAQLQCHVGCASLPAKQDRLDRVDRWIRDHRLGSITGLGAKLDQLKPAW